MLKPYDKQAEEDFLTQCAFISQRLDTIEQRCLRNSGDLIQSAAGIILIECIVASALTAVAIFSLLKVVAG